ncbi:MAG: hypothetical protein OXF62_11290 [Caldilineaceae bacterium]|nr:hypothetical protein [Caldilineaceae bacterium]
MTEDFRERGRELGRNLRAMLEGELGEGVRASRNLAARRIVHLFGVVHARDLDGLEMWEMAYVAGQAGLPAKRYAEFIRDGRELALYVVAKQDLERFLRCYGNVDGLAEADGTS